MLLADQITVDAASVRETRDGYLVAEARIARTGIQTYTAAEMGLTDRNPSDVIKVYRSAEEVFDRAAMESMTWRPMTNDHPQGTVTADSWKSVAVGMTGDRAKRQVAADGEYLVVPLTMMDRKAIEDWRGGKRELSCGYSCDVQMTAGTTPKGEAYDAVQSNIRGNHVALCDHARGGSKLTFGDAPARSEAQIIFKNWFDSQGDQAVSTKKIIVDGLEVETTDAAEKAIVKLQGQLADALTAKAKAETDLAAAVTASTTKDAEITTLKQQLADAAITPAKLQDAARAYATVCAQAKALGVTVADGADTEAIKKAVVTAKMGDLAKDWGAEQIAASFNTLAKDAKVETVDPLRKTIIDGVRAASDGADVRNLARAMQYN